MFWKWVQDGGERANATERPLCGFPRDLNSRYCTCRIDPRAEQDKREGESSDGTQHPWSSVSPLEKMSSIRDSYLLQMCDLPFLTSVLHPCSSFPLSSEPP